MKAHTTNSLLTAGYLQGLVCTSNQNCRLKGMSAINIWAQLDRQTTFLQLCRSKFSRKETV